MPLLERAAQLLVNLRDTVRDAAAIRELAETEVAVARAIAANARAIARETELELEVRRLTDALEFKSRSAKRGEAYFELDAAGEPMGDPYCVGCLDSKHARHHLTWVGHDMTCPVCKVKYDNRRIKYPGARID